MKPLSESTLKELKAQGYAAVHKSKIVPLMVSTIMRAEAIAIADDGELTHWVHSDMIHELAAELVRTAVISFTRERLQVGDMIPARRYVATVTVINGEDDHL